MKTREQINDELKTKDRILSFTNRVYDRKASRVRSRVRNNSVYTSHPKWKEKRIKIFEEQKIANSYKNISKKMFKWLPKDKWFGFFRKLFA